MTAGIGEKVFTSSHLCNIIGFTWYAVEKLSIFAVVLLNITRNISIFFPFLKIRKRIVIAAMIFLTMLPFFLYGYTFLLGGHFEYQPLHGVCNKHLNKIFDFNSIDFRAYYGTILFIFHVMPVLIMVVCLVLSTVKMFHSRKEGGRTTENKDRATRTILLLGLIYMILNVPYNCMYTANLLYVWKILDRKKYPLYRIDSVLEHRVALAFEFFSLFISVMLNPAINILVCVFRVRRLREYTINCIKCQCRTNQPKSEFGRTSTTVFGRTSTTVFGRTLTTVFGRISTTVQNNVYPNNLRNQVSIPQNIGQVTSISPHSLGQVEVEVLRNPSADVITNTLPVQTAKMM